MTFLYISLDYALPKQGNLTVGTLRYLMFTGKNSESEKKDSAKPVLPVIKIPAPETKLSSNFANAVPTDYSPSLCYGKIKYNNADSSSEVYNVEGSWSDSLLRTRESFKYELDEDDERFLRGLKDTLMNPEQCPTDSTLEEIIEFLETQTSLEVPISEKHALYILEQTDIEYDNERGLLEVNNLRNKIISGEVTSLEIKKVYQHWFQKRQNLHKPLLRQFWPKTSENEQNPELVFRAREKDRYKLRKKKGNDEEQFWKLLQFLKDLQIVQYVIDIVKRREKLKLIDYEVGCLLFKTKAFPKEPLVDHNAMHKLRSRPSDDERFDALAVDYQQVNNFLYFAEGCKALVKAKAMGTLPSTPTDSEGHAQSPPKSSVQKITSKSQRPVSTHNLSAAATANLERYIYEFSPEHKNRNKNKHARGKRNGQTVLEQATHQQTEEQRVLDNLPFPPHFLVDKYFLNRKCDTADVEEKDFELDCFPNYPDDFPSGFCSSKSALKKKMAPKRSAVIAAEKYIESCYNADTKDVEVDDYQARYYMPVRRVGRGGRVMFDRIPSDKAVTSTPSMKPNKYTISTQQKRAIYDILEGKL